MALAERFPGATIIGVDLDSEVLQEPRRNSRRQENPECDFQIIGENGLLQTVDKTFDIIVMRGVLHCLADPRSVLNEVKSVLRMDGYLVTFDPPLHSDHRKNAGDFSAASRFVVSISCVCHTVCPDQRQ